MRDHDLYAKIYYWRCLFIENDDHTVPTIVSATAIFDISNAVGISN